MKSEISKEYKKILQSNFDEMRRTTDQLSENSTSLTINDLIQSCILFRSNLIIFYSLSSNRHGLYEKCKRLVQFNRQEDNFYL